jgi:hypothetical protein
MRKATGLMKKFRGHHMIHISQWSKPGEDELLTVRFWNADFLLVRVD